MLSKFKALTTLALFQIKYFPHPFPFIALEFTKQLNRVNVIRVHLFTSSTQCVKDQDVVINICFPLKTRDDILTSFYLYLLSWIFGLRVKKLARTSSCIKLTQTTVSSRNKMDEERC